MQYKEEKILLTNPKTTLILVVTLGAIGLIFLSMDLISYFKVGALFAIKSGLTAIYLIMLLFLAVLFYIGKLAEDKNLPESLVLNHDNCILEYKNGNTNCINLHDIRKVNVSAVYSKFSFVKFDITAVDSSYKIESGYYPAILKFLKFLKENNVDIAYSSNLVESDLENALETTYNQSF